MATHRALGLVSNLALRQEISTLLPAYEFTWDLVLAGAIQTAADLRPSLMIIALEDDSTGWAEIVTALLSNPATRRIPLVALASAPSDALLKKAAAVSLTSLILMKDLPKQLPDWVNRHARVWDAEYYASLKDACAEDLPPLAQEGIALFNQREFWEAHEVLEHAWIEVRPHPIGEVYRSILQVGVAYYQIQRQNYRGAIKMFLRAVQWLDPLPDQCQGIDIAQFKQDAAAARKALETLGADHIADFDPSLFKPVPLIK